MSLATFQLVSNIVLLAVALGLFASPLPQRDDFWFRLVIIAVLTVMVAAVSVQLGFSLYPTLSDDLSFARAIWSFFIVLLILITAQLTLWDCSLLTALYCSSSAYVLENLAEGFNRLLHIMGVSPALQITSQGPLTVSALEVFLAILTAAIPYTLFYMLVCRKLQGSALQRVRNATMSFAIVMAVLVGIIFDLVIKDLAMYQHPVRYNYVLCIVHITACSFILMAEYEILYNQTLQANISTMERTMAEQQRQFELSRSTIAAINRRCHDIRHHILRVLSTDTNDVTLTREQLAEVARGIDVYESVLRTGNAALDVVLTEKGLLARQANVILSCVADGHALDFMTAADLYALFSAMLDKALAAVEALQDSRRKSISLNVRDRMGMASVSLEHYLPPEEDVSPEELQRGALTLKTIAEIIERYDGTMSYSEKGSEVIHIDLLIPQNKPSGTVAP